MSVKPFISVKEAEKITSELVDSGWKKFGDFLIENQANKNYIKHFKSLEKPTIQWKKIGFRTAGQTFIAWNLIQMNINYLYSKDYAEFIPSTLLHELAHIIAGQMYGDCGHKSYWKLVDKILGDDASRCHNYETPINAPLKDRVELTCHYCHNKCVVTPKMAAKILNNPTGYYCRKCMHDTTKVSAKNIKAA